MNKHVVLSASLLLAAGICHADVPTAEQECRLRNSATCELSGVQYLVEGPCPPGALAIRPQGHERCDAVPQARTAPAPPRPDKGVAIPAPRQDLAWVGRMERSRGEKTALDALSGEGAFHGGRREHPVAVANEVVSAALSCAATRACLCGVAGIALRP